MDALGQRVPIESMGVADERGHTDLPVEHHFQGQLLAGSGNDLGKVACEVLATARADDDLVAVAKDQRAESVPFRLVGPFRIVGGLGRNRARRFGEHRRDRRSDGEIHLTIVTHL